MVFLPRPSATEEEIHLAQEDMEVCFYDGGEIDLGQAVRDEVSLAVPMGPGLRRGLSGHLPGVRPQPGKRPLRLLQPGAGPSLGQAQGFQIVRNTKRSWGSAAIYGDKSHGCT